MGPSWNMAQNRCIRIPAWILLSMEHVARTVASTNRGPTSTLAVEDHVGSSPKCKDDLEQARQNKEQEWPGPWHPFHETGCGSLGL